MTRITIDGPSGAGKSTISKLLAKKLNYNYLDTGAMYRAITFGLMQMGLKLEDEQLICNNINNLKLSFNDGIKLNKVNIEKEIRSQEVTKNVSLISSYECVREQLVKLQRDFALGNDIILDGRDTGSVVIPDAEYKFYLTASKEERAKRRYLEFKDSRDDSYEDVLKDIIRRDNFDMNREISPLVVPDNAIIIDSTDMNIEQTVDYIFKIIEDK